MKLSLEKFEAGVIGIRDLDSKGMTPKVADVYGHSEKEAIALGKLFAAAPGIRESLQAVVDQAEAQFKAGDRYATFSKVQIAQFKEDLKKAL